MGNGDSDNVEDAWEVLQQAAVALWDKFDQDDPSWLKRVGLLSKKPIGSLHKIPKHEVPSAYSRGCQPTETEINTFKLRSGDSKAERKTPQSPSNNLIPMCIYVYSSHGLSGSSLHCHNGTLNSWRDEPASPVVLQWKV